MKSRTMYALDRVTYIPLERDITHYGLGDVETLFVHW